VVAVCVRPLAANEATGGHGPAAGARRSEKASTERFRQTEHKVRRQAKHGERLDGDRLMRMARGAIAIEAPADRAITPSLLAAIALVESGGLPTATGDEGRSVGLFQFSVAAWQDAARGPASKNGARGWTPADRRNPNTSMRAAVRWLSWGAERMKKGGLSVNVRTLAAFHNSGRVPSPSRTAYARKVARMEAKMRTLQARTAAR
jgi:hypothetical protein